MPRLDQDGEMQTHKLAGNFQFTGVPLKRLGASEYTLVTIAVDVTGSVSGFEDSLRTALTTAVKACKKSPRSENLLLRVLTFSTSVGIAEIHGFKLLSEIDPDNDYPQFRPDGMTPLLDATYSAVAALVDYGKQLMSQDFLCNGIAFIITDGEDNHSTATCAMIKAQIEKARHGEDLESLVSVLIGVNLQGCQPALDRFKTEAGIDQFIDVGNATPGKLAKLANFVSQSVSSQSQALGTGGPSQAIAPTI